MIESLDGIMGHGGTYSQNRSVPVWSIPVWSGLHLSGPVWTCLVTEIDWSWN